MVVCNGIRNPRNKYQSRNFTIFLSLFLAKVYAAIALITTISTTEMAVTNTEFPKLLKKSIALNAFHNSEM